MAIPGDDDRTERVEKLSLTLGSDTIRQNPRERIVPGGRRAPTQGQALAMVEALVGRALLPTTDRLDFSSTIATGGMGIVYEANQVALGRTVAVKTLRPDKRSDDAVLDLLREAWITGSLEHPNVVPVHDMAVDESGAPVLVLKRIEGQPWSQLMHDETQVRERFGEGDQLDWNIGILMQVLNAVRFAHRRGIVHRDLKPDNVMIGEFGEVYLVDWGLAVSLSDDGTGRLPLAADATEMAGTPCYMAPEMLADSDLPITELTDIYLIGAILYEILTGSPPHMGNDIVAVVTSVVMSSPVFPNYVPHTLERICRRAMDPDPAGRFENAEQVRLALQGFLKHRGSERLAEKATAALTDLTRELARGRSSDAERRQRLYRLFGACRFGFQEALAAWPRNHEARAGLEQATEVMLRYELAQGDARAAAAIGADFPDPPPALRQLIDTALHAADQEKHRLARLERLSRQFDIRTGSHTRLIAAVILGLTFTLAPLLVIGRYGPMAFGTHPRIIVWNTSYLMLGVLVGLWMRKGMSESVINRRIYGMMMALLIAYIPLAPALWRAGFTPRQSLLVHVFCWFFLVALAVVSVEKRLIPAALGYLAAFLALAEWPESVRFVMIVPHAVLTVNVVLIWKPQKPAASMSNRPV